MTKLVQFGCSVYVPTLTAFDLQTRTLSLLDVIRQLPIGQKLLTKQFSSYLTWHWLTGVRISLCNWKSLVPLWMIWPIVLQHTEKKARRRCGLLVNTSFLLLLQMTNVTREHCLEIINKFEPCLENKKAGALGIDGKLAGIAAVGEGKQCLNAYKKSHVCMLKKS